MNRWPVVTPRLFLVLSVLLAFGLSVAAAIVRPTAGPGGLQEVVMLNVMWGPGYGGSFPDCSKALSF